MSLGARILGPRHTGWVSVRDANKRRTRLALAEAAVDLFTERGYDKVSMDDVATAAGVSRRTAFRYFGSKADLVMEIPLSWIQIFDRSIAEQESLPLAERLRIASHAIASHIEADADRVRRAFVLSLTHPALGGAYAAMNRRWIERVEAEILKGEEPTPEATMRARVLASAAMGMIDSVCELWAEQDHPMHPLLDLGFDMLDPAFVR